jgi:DNA-binding response OmpR family regulator
MARPMILIVEDCSATCEALQDLLEGEGYAVECAPTGALALARLERGDVDVVLLDLLLPDLTGLELCQQVRQQEGEVYLPIIMLTALHSKAERHAGFEAGADDYLTKPFDVQELLDRVRVWIRTRQHIVASRERAAGEVGSAAAAPGPPSIVGYVLDRGQDPAGAGPRGRRARARQPQ